MLITKAVDVPLLSMTAERRSSAAAVGGRLQRLVSRVCQ